jgi:hypothetical protein
LYSSGNRAVPKQKDKTMNKFPIVAALALLLAGFCNGHAQAVTHKADRLLIVGGKTYVNRPCDYEPFGTQSNPDGSFMLGVVHPKPNGWFAYVNLNNDGTGTAKGAWNEGASHAHSDIGTGVMHKVGACWESDPSNKVCAWQLGEPRYFVD